jgi:hypothetical protein
VILCDAGSVLVCFLMNVGKLMFRHLDFDRECLEAKVVNMAKLIDVQLL